MSDQLWCNQNEDLNKQLLCVLLGLVIKKVFRGRERWYFRANDRLHVDK